jgi:hypothetical protein
MEIASLKARGKTKEAGELEEKFNERIEHITNLRDELYQVYRQFV